MSSTLRPSRTVATLSAALLLGAGGGAGAALAIDGGNNTATPARAVPGQTMAVASTSSDTSSVNAVYGQSKQGVVDITVKSEAGTAEGSGFVLDKGGNVVTNQHVVDGASAVEVNFADGSKAAAKVVGADPSSDLAVIRVSGVDPAKLQPLPVGDSSKAEVGNSVIAIGSPYGLKGSLSVGVVSALDRTITSPNHFSISGAIQTDAAINHGNSGGPLLNTDGQVIGVNAQIKSETGENTGVGFAIPSNTVKSVSTQILEGGQVGHPFMGVQLADADAGPTIAALTAGGPGADAGLQKGDVVTSVDGKNVESSDALVTAIQAHKVGDKVNLTVTRGGATQQVEVTLGNQSSS
jgi:putative serine protease PepD